jgi:hypothetical protein
LTAFKTRLTVLLAFTLDTICYLETFTLFTALTGSTIAIISTKKAILFLDAISFDALKTIITIVIQQTRSGPVSWKTRLSRQLTIESYRAHFVLATGNCTKTLFIFQESTPTGQTIRVLMTLLTDFIISLVMIRITAGK